MRDEKHGFALCLPEVKKLVFHQLTRLNVKRGKRFVHQNDVGILDQRLSHRHALSHAAREMVRITILKPGQPDARQPLAGSLSGLFLRHPLEKKSCRHIVQSTLPGHQAVGLKHVSGSAIEADKRFTEDADSTGAGLQKSCAHIEQCGFAAAGGADDTHKLTVGHRQIHIFDSRVGGQGPGIVTHKSTGNAFEFYCSLRHLILSVVFQK